jgi:hypothetical protein
MKRSFIFLTQIYIPCYKCITGNIMQHQMTCENEHEYLGVFISYEKVPLQHFGMIMSYLKVSLYHLVAIMSYLNIPLKDLGVQMSYLKFHYRTLEQSWHLWNYCYSICLERSDDIVKSVKLPEMYEQTELACSVCWEYSVWEFHKDYRQQPTCVLTFTTLDFSISSNAQQNEWKNAFIGILYTQTKM